LQAKKHPQENPRKTRRNKRYPIFIISYLRDPTSTLLQNCASDSSKTFMLTQASQIVTVFNQIATKLSKLRVAR